MMTALEPTIFSAPEIQSYFAGKIVGELPEYVRGTLYINGPARFRIGETTRRHWLDGDGLARSLTIEGEHAHYRARYVETEKFVRESAAHRPLYRTFGWAAAGDLLRAKILLETPANVSLYPFAGRLLAFGEQALPYALDGETLATLGECNFSGHFNAMTPLSAHPKLDRASGHLCNFGIAYLGGLAKLNYSEVNDQLQPVLRGSCVLKGANYIHDFAISPRFALFHLSPYRVDIRQFMSTVTPLQDAMHWDGAGGFSLRILDRSSGKELADVPLPRPGFCLHTINAFEQGQRLFLDLVDTPLPFFDQYIAAPSMFSQLLPCATVRYVIDTDTWRLLDMQVYEAGCHYDFPNSGRLTAQRNYPCFWAAAMPAAPTPTPKFYNRLFRFGWQSERYEDAFETAEHQVLGGEPLVVENPLHPERVTVISQGYDLLSARSSYLFFDGHQLSRGPLARLELPFFDPLGFHSSWQSAG